MVLSIKPLSRWLRFTYCVALMVLAALSKPSFATSIDPEIKIESRLVNSQGKPVSGKVNLSVQLGNWNSSPNQIYYQKDFSNYEILASANGKISLKCNLQNNDYSGDGKLAYSDLIAQFPLSARIILTVNGQTSVFPATQLNAAPFALRAAQADSAASVSASSITGIISVANLPAAGSLGAGAISSEHLASNSVSGLKIDSGTFGSGLSRNVTTGQVSVDTTTIASKTYADGKIVNDSTTSNWTSTSSAPSQASVKSAIDSISTSADNKVSNEAYNVTNWDNDSSDQTTAPSKQAVKNKIVALSTDIATAQSTANTASTNASTALTTANTASTNAAAAQTAATGAALKANNLSDLASAGTARTNLGLGTMSTQDASGINVTGGTVTGATINNTVIGGTTPVAGTFSTLTSTGNSSLGGTLAVAGNSTLSGTLGVTGVTTLSNLTAGGVVKATSGTGALTASSVVDNDISSTAAITRTKLANGTAYRLVANDASGVMGDSLPITAAKALVSNANGLPVASGVSDTELGYLSGVTSAIQTQINSINTTAGAALVKASNLSDLTNTTTARTNLGLGSMATQDGSAVNITGGTVAGATINNTAIGGTTAAAGSFTTLASSGNTTVNGNLSVVGTSSLGTLGMGNTTVTGTLGVTGVATLSNLGGNGSLPVKTSNTGVLSASTLVDADIDAAAAIAVTKLAASTEGKILQNINTTPSWVVLDQPGDLQNFSFTAGVASNELTIALKNKAGNNPSGTDRVGISFRDTSATSGLFNKRYITAALSLTIPQGCTLGHSDSVDGYLYLYALDNGGTVELAVSGSPNFSEGSLQTSAAIGGCASNSNVLYSNSIRTSVPIRILGRVLSNQATAGTWATSPTELALSPLINQKSGTILQSAYTQSSTQTAIATAISVADLTTTALDITGGDEIFSLTFTPRMSGSKIRLEWSITGTENANSGDMWAALMYLSGDASPRSVSITNDSNVGGINGGTVHGQYQFDSTGNAFTVKIRAGSNNGSSTLNKLHFYNTGFYSSGNPLWSWLKIEEIQP